MERLKDYVYKNHIQELEETTERLTKQKRKVTGNPISKVSRSQVVRAVLDKSNQKEIGLEDLAL